jgi:hypothetical protein
MKNIIYILLFIIGISYTSCKKYPENTLWFKRVKKLEFFDNVKLISYTVNGVDSLAALNKYFGSKVFSKDITSLSFDEIFDVHFKSNVPRINVPNGNNGNYQLTFFYSYSKNKKKLEIVYDLMSYNDTAVFSRSFFVEQITEWQIMKFDPKGIRKIKTTINNNAYEMEFNAL